ncbi:MAG: DUF3105 domain-containing protein [Patescibacteria group bacterium]
MDDNIKLNDLNLDWSKLSKKERKRLAKEKKRQQAIVDKKKASFGKWFGIGIVTFIILFGIVWIVASVVKESSKPLPGKEVAILGRTHVAVGTKVKYNSNPPTSGNHYDTWTKSGVHDKEVEDGYLVHSLEHGYVILHYNCNAGNSKFQIPNSKLGTGSAETIKDCQKFVNKLKERVKKDSWKLILIPRKNLDANFALTSWGSIDKFDVKEGSLERVNDFIDSFRNNGPEKTME